MKVINFICCFVLGGYFFASAQNTMTSSPYSMFGLGEISQGLSGQNVGMGGVSYGIRNPSFLNMDNPAGLTGMDSCKLIMDVSTFIRNEAYKSKGASNNAFTGNFSSLVLGGRIMRPWYIAVGITPYSSVGYYFKSEQPLEGTSEGTVTSTFEGSGGLSKVSLSNAILLPFNISLGVNIHYLFGTITQQETQSSISTKQEMYTNTFYADFGLQFHRQLGKQTTLSLGSVYGYKQKLSFDNTTWVTSSLGTSEYKERNKNQYIPMYWGAGASLQHKSMTYALDYTFRQYDVLSSGKSSILFKNSHELKSGISFFPAATNPYAKSYWSKVYYKVGMNVSTPYMQINGKAGTNWRVSAGLGLPVLNGLLNAAFFYDRTKYDGNRFTKDIIGVTVSLTIEERFLRLKL